MTELLRPREVADLLRTTVEAVYARVERGQLDFCLVRERGRLLFNSRRLRRHLGLTTVPPAPHSIELASTGSDKEP